MLVTELGIVIDIRELPQKAPLPIFVTELGMSTEVKLVQAEKAEPGIVLTELGMLTEAKLAQ